MMTLQRVILFGDQTVEKAPSIRTLVRLSTQSPALQRFLQDATDIVQREVTKLDAATRKSFLAFDNLLSLAEQNAKATDRTEVVPTTLMTIVRLGELILHVEDDPTILNCSFARVHMLGLCTGLLPAVAAAVAKTTKDLHNIGLEIVAIAVRLGNGIAVRSKLVEAAPGTWGYSIVGATTHQTQTILNKFHTEKGVPVHRQAYLAVTSRTWTTVFGPPSVLTELWAYSPELGLAPKLKLAAEGAVHASHLPELDVDSIIGDSVILEIPYPPDARITSSSTCLPYVANDVRALLHQMIADIGQNTLRLTETVGSLVNNILHTGSEVDLIVVGPTAHTRMLQGALQDSSVKVKLITEPRIAPSVEVLRGGSGKVAIVGMSGRFPGSESIYEFWENLQKGKDFHQKIPASRFNLDEHYDPAGSLKSSLTTEHGCFLENPGSFDCRLFNISPREALQMEPVQRLLLMTSYEAMEMAGYTPGGNPSADPKRIATYMAQTTDDWREINQTQGIDIYYVPGIVRAFTPGRINYHFKWEGPSYSVDTACSGSTTTVQLACRALLSRECDTALAGGGQVNATPAGFAGTGRGGFLSPTGGCKTFSGDADGYCRGEGVGVVVLKRLEDAVEDNDRILAVISGSVRTYSAEAVSITQPHLESQVKVFKKVLQQASMDPQDVGYIEMHGTGTKLGDSTEMQSVAEVFGAARSKEHPLAVGAVKANVGHSEAGAGITSLIKCVLLLQQGGPIPPQPGMPFTLNPKFPPLDKMHIEIADGNTHLKPRPIGDGKRKILVNNFDASGGNTCIALEEPPAVQGKQEDPRKHHVVVCSARTSRSLRENKKRLLRFVDLHQDVKLSDLAYSTTARRMHDVFRASYVTENISNLSKLLASDLDTSGGEKEASIGGQTSVAFAFTGQGSLYSGMGRQLFETCSAFRDSILSYQEICDSQGLPRVVDLIAESDADPETKTMVQLQLAIVFIELALANLLRSWGIQPDLLIGHSLGEYAAMCTAGVISVSDTLYLVGQRSRMIEEKCVRNAHTMLSVSSSVKFINDALSDERHLQYEVSCMNAPDITVLGGSIRDLESIQRKIHSLGVKTTFLNVSYGFHSVQIEPILEELENSARGIHFEKPIIPIASTLTGTIIREVGTFTPAYIARQARRPVNFAEALQACKSAGVVNSQSLWVETGPEPVCLGLVRANLGVSSTRLFPSIRSSENNWKTISNCAAAAYTSKVPISWTDFHREYINALTFLELPTYGFDLKDYWVTYKKDDTIPGPTGTELKTLNAATGYRKYLGATCLHYVEKEFYENDEVAVTFCAHTSEPKFFDTIQGHLVDNTAICPASVFCDMALTAARYTYMTGKSGQSEPDMSVCSMDITHPLVVPRKNHEQIVEVLAVKPKGNNWSTIQITFKSREGSAQHEHGSCVVRFGNDDGWKNAFSRTFPLIKKRIDDLVKSGIAGKIHRLQRPVVYKLFANLVDYSENYQGLEEVFLDTEYGDAAAQIKLRPIASAGEFTLSPYWMDAIVHLAGFVLNGNMNIPKGVAYISAGFEEFHLLDKLRADRTYTSYVSMRPGEKKDLFVGDVYVYEGDNLVALCGGLFFHKMTKKILRIIFGLDENSSPAQHVQDQTIGGVSRRLQVQSNSNDGVEQTRQSHSNSKSLASAPSTKTSSQHSTADTSEGPDVAEIILEIVASESGFELTDMEPTTLFTDMGVDSLMSIAITSTVQKRTGVELGASFFQDHPAVEDVKREFGKGALHENAEAVAILEPVPNSPPPHLGESTPETDASLPEPVGGTGVFVSRESSGIDLAREGYVELEKPEAAKDPPPNQVPRAKLTAAPTKQEKQYASNVVLIRGRPSSKNTPLFLVTDGSGSATAYIHLPPLSTGNRIYALESPFLHDPTAYNCTVQEVGALYIAAIRKTQPQGPYIIGGWSAGAVYAFEVTRQLLNQGETILGLILIDMRVPRRMPDALEPTKELIQAAGVFTGIERSGQAKSSAADNLKQHLVSTVAALVDYEPIPLDPARRPAHNFLIWAQRGLSESRAEDPFKVEHFEDKAQKIRPDQANVMEEAQTGLKSWFYDRRSVFGPNGWDALIGEVECHVMEGADHFDMVVPPKVKELGIILDNAVKKCMENHE